MEQVINWELFYDACQRNDKKLKETDESIKAENNFLDKSESSSDGESEDDLTDDFLTLYVNVFKWSKKRIICNYCFFRKVKLNANLSS